MNMARIYYKNGHVVWTWHRLNNGRYLVNKNFFDKEGYYRADASYREEISWELLNISLDTAKQFLDKVEVF